METNGVEQMEIDEGEQIDNQVVELQTLFSFAERNDIKSIAVNIINKENYSDIINMRHDGKRVIDKAWKDNYYDLVLVLLLGDSYFPENFILDDNVNNIFQSKIMGIASGVNSFHDQIIRHKELKDTMKAIADVKILYKESFSCLAVNYGFTSYCDCYAPKYYFNTSSNSAALTAIEYKRYDVYSYLMTLHFYMKKEEYQIFDLLPKKVSNKTSEFLEGLFHFIGSAHVSFLLSRTKMLKTDSSAYEKIRYFYSLLDKIPEVSNILKALKHCDRIVINVDLRNEKASEMDPRCLQTFGHSYVWHGQVYAALGRGEKLALGTLSHEFAHLAMFEVFRNESKPYEKQDISSEQTFKQLTLETKNSWKFVNTKTEEEQGMKNIIGGAFGYPESEHEVELIARIVEIFAVYEDQGKKWIEFNFCHLFSFFHEVLLKIQRAINLWEVHKPSKDLKLINQYAGYEKDEKIQLVADHTIEFTFRNFLKSDDWSFCHISDAYTCAQLCNFLYVFFKNIIKEKSPDDYYFFTFDVCNKHLDDIIVAFAAAKVNLITLLFTEIKIEKERLREILLKFFEITLSSTKKIIFLVFDENRSDFAEAWDRAFSLMEKDKQAAAACFEKKYGDSFKSVKIENLESFKFESIKHQPINMQLTLKDYDLNSQTYILQKENIIFQGKVTSLCKLLNIQNVEIISDSKLDFLLNLEPKVIQRLIIGENVHIGENFPSYNNSYYISRNFSQVEIKQAIQRSKSFGDKVCFSREEFENFSSLFPEENIHWLERKSTTLVWQKTRGSILSLYEYIVRNQNVSTLCSESDLLRLQSQLKVIIISDEAGMGKSTVLSYLCQEIYKLNANDIPPNWIFRVNLNDYTRILREYMEDSKMSIEMLANYMLKLNEPLDQMLFHSGLIKTVVMFDGFDEICPTYEAIVIELIKYLLNKVNNLWISTRQNKKNELEKEFQVFAFSLIPFSSNKEQFELLNKIWVSKLKEENIVCSENEESKKLDLYCNDIINIFSKQTTIENRDKFLSKPLHLIMVGDIFYKNEKKCLGTFKSVKDFITSRMDKPELKENFDVLDLYESFLRKLLYEYYLVGKLDYDLSKIDTNPIKICENIYFNCQIAALKRLTISTHLFHINEDLFEEFRKEIIDGTLKIGFLHCNSFDNTLQFTHLTYAEYLASVFIAEQLIQSVGKEFHDIIALVNRLLPNNSLLFLKSFWKCLMKHENKFFEILKEATFFDFAVKNGFMNIIRAIMEIEIDTMFNNKESGITGLHLATKSGEANVVKYFLGPQVNLYSNTQKNKNASKCININEKDSYGHTALYYAVENERFEIGYDLLINGADCSSLDDNRLVYSFVCYIFKKIFISEFKLFFNFHKNPLRETNHLVKVLEIFFKHFCDFYYEIPSESRIVSMYQFFCFFLWHGRTLVLKHITECLDYNDRKDIFLYTDGRQTILEVISKSIYLNDNEKLDILIFMINGDPYLKKTIEDNDEFLEQIVEQGSLKTFMYFTNHRNHSIPIKFLISALKNSHFIFVWYLLKRNCFKSDDTKMSPLCLAIKSNACLKLIKYIYSVRSDTETKKWSDRNILKFAISEKQNCHLINFLLNLSSEDNLICSKKNYPQVLNLLLDCGAHVYDDDMFISEENMFQIYFNLSDSTNLISAIKNKNFEWSEFFIRRGDDVNQQDEYGKTPLHWACYVRNFDIVKLLLQHGAMFDATDFKTHKPAAELKTNAGPDSIIAQMKIGKLLDEMSQLFNSNECHNFEAHENIACYFLNARNFEKRTLLHIAVKKNNINTVTKLLDFNQKYLEKKLKWIHMNDESCEMYRNYQPFSVDSVDIEGNSPLHIACRNNNKRIINTLLREGAIFNIKNNAGKTPIDLSKDYKHLLTSTEACFEDVKDGKSLNLVGILQQCLNVKNIEGDSFLHQTIKHKRQELFVFLLGRDINLNCQNLDGYTPLHLAVKHSNICMIRRLLQRGAFFNAFSKELKTPLEYANGLTDLSLKKYLDLINEMFKIVLSDSPERILNHIESIQQCSIPLPIIVNAYDRRSHCVLHYATKFSHFSVVRILLENGAMYNCKNLWGETSMDIASSLHIKQLLQLIHDLFCNFDMLDEIKGEVGFKMIKNVRNEKGLTLLHIAAIENNQNLVVKLIKSGADVHAEDMYGKDICHYAKRNVKNIIKQYIKMQEYIHDGDLNDAEKIWKKLKKFYQRFSVKKESKGLNQKSSRSRSQPGKRRLVRSPSTGAKKSRIAASQDQRFSVKKESKGLNQKSSRSRSQPGKRRRERSPSTGAKKSRIAASQEETNNDPESNPPRTQSDESSLACLPSTSSKKPQTAIAQEKYESLVFQLTDMGISMKESKRALHETQNKGIEEALDWYLDHINEDFNEPLADNSKAAEAIEAIVMMGFTSDQASMALEATNNNLVKAVSWIFQSRHENGKT
nr:uncharacterized protein LOC107456566 isoform X3 [Parasteatoda tepidariorum]